MPLPATALRYRNLGSVPLPPVALRPVPARSLDDALARLNEDVPSELQAAYFSTVRCPTGSGCDARALAVERFGLPLGPPTADPRQPRRLYQRFENAVLWAEGQSHGQLPVGRILRNLLLATDLSTPLRAEASSGPLFAQYDPAQPLALVRPAELMRTDLRSAF